KAAPGGHMFVSDNTDALCGCGNIGDVEAITAGNAIGRRLGADAPTLFRLAQQGDRDAEAKVDELCRVLGRALYNLVAALDLEGISIGGSVFWHTREYLLPKLKAQVAGKLPALTDGCELIGAGLEDK